MLAQGTQQHIQNCLESIRDFERRLTSDPNNDADFYRRMVAHEQATIYLLSPFYFDLNENNLFPSQTGALNSIRGHNWNNSRW